MPRIQVRNVTLYYEEAGEGAPLLLLPGVGSSTPDWEAQIAAFSQHYRVMAVDMRGHGRSDKPKGPYSIPMFAADTAAFIEALHLGAAHVVGLSMGGMIAFQLAVDYPHLVKSMVIVNSVPEWPRRTLKEKWFVWQRLLLLRLVSMPKIAETIGGRLFPEPHQAELRQTFVERSSKNDKRAFLASNYAMLRWSVTGRLPNIQTPTLVIASDMDYTPLSLKEGYVGQMPHAQLVVIEDSRHATPADQPERFNAAVLRFLAQATAGG